MLCMRVHGSRSREKDKKWKVVKFTADEMTPKHSYASDNTHRVCARMGLLCEVLCGGGERFGWLREKAGAVERWGHALNRACWVPVMRIVKTLERRVKKLKWRVRRSFRKLKIRMNRMRVEVVDFLGHIRDYKNSKIVIHRRRRRVPCLDDPEPQWWQEEEERILAIRDRRRQREDHHDYYDSCMRYENMKDWWIGRETIMNHPQFILDNARFNWVGILEERVGDREWWWKHREVLFENYAPVHMLKFWKKEIESEDEGWNIYPERHRQPRQEDEGIDAIVVNNEIRNVVSDKEEEEVTSGASDYSEEETYYEEDSEYDVYMDGYASSDESEFRERWEYEMASDRVREGH